MFKTSAAGATGSVRMKQIAAANVVEVEKLTAHLIAGLKRPPIPAEEIAAEVIASTVIRSRRLRERGRDDASERRLLGRLMRETPFGMVPAPSPAEIQHGKAVADAYAAHDRQAGLDALHGYTDAE